MGGGERRKEHTDSVERCALVCIKRLLDKEDQRITFSIEKKGQRLQLRSPAILQRERTWKAPAMKKDV